MFGAVLCDGLEDIQVMVLEVAPADAAAAAAAADNRVTVCRGMLPLAADAVKNQGALRCANAMFSPGDCQCT